MWQKEEGLRIKEFAKNNLESLIDFDIIMKGLERELGNGSYKGCFKFG
jgi:hypothetical protein